jgi:hypothetical protein
MCIGYKGLKKIPGKAIIAVLQTLKRHCIFCSFICVRGTIILVI